MRMTAIAFFEDGGKSKASGRNGGLSKPADLNLLYGTIHPILMKKF